MMKSKTIVFASRYGSQRVVEKINENQYTIEGPSRFLRWSGGPSNLTMVDFEGGPYIVIDDSMTLLEVDDERKVSKIENISDQDKYAKILLTVS